MGNRNSIASEGKEHSSNPNDHTLNQSISTTLRRSDFADDFVFGSSTASYQIEGGAREGGRGHSIWDHLALTTPGHINDGSNGNVAANQYHMYKDDVKSMKNVGLNAYRFSISWSRILPDGKLSSGKNPDGIKYYHNLIDAILAQGMEPYVTLFHWDLPQSLEQEYGGFLDKRIVDDFRDFAGLCFWEYGDKVKHWITINEPWTYTVRGYCWGSFPPSRGSVEAKEMVHKMAITLLHRRGHSTDHKEMKEYVGNAIAARSFSSSHDVAQHMNYYPASIEQGSGPEMIDLEFTNDLISGTGVDYKNHRKAQTCDKGSDPSWEPYKVAHNFLLAHAAAVDLYKKGYDQGSQGGKIGMTNNANWYLPYHENNEGDQEAAKRALDFMLGWFVAPLVTGDYPQSMKDRVGDRLPRFSKAEKEMVKGSYDFMGINYYTTYYALSLTSIPHSVLHYDLDMEVFSSPTRDGHPIGPKAGSDWLYIYPPGICHLLVHIRDTYEDPLIYITENGVDEKHYNSHTISEACQDPIRVEYHYEHLRYMKAAIERGVNVKAYFIWSFADNFEWDEGYGVRFGIFYVDFKDRYLRYPKKSALWWKRFLHNVEVHGSRAMLGEDGDEE